MEPPTEIPVGGSFANSARSDAPPRRVSLFVVLGVLGGIGFLFITAIVIGGFMIASLVAPKDPPTDPAPVETVVPPLRPDHTQDLEKMENTKEAQQVLRSTLVIKFTDLTGQSEIGTGFLVDKQGFVLTNAHAVGLGPLKIHEPMRYDVYFNFGLPDQRMIVATLHGVDVHQNLALLKISSSDLPPPLVLKPTADFMKMNEVVTFGPISGKQVSTNKNTVSGQFGEEGKVQKTLLSGLLCHETSGGPVTNLEGDVVGVCVADQHGTLNHYVIPPEIAWPFIREQIASGGTRRLGRLEPKRDRKEEDSKREFQRHSKDDFPHPPGIQTKQDSPPNLNMPRAPWDEKKNDFQPSSNPLPYPRVRQSENARPPEAAVAKPRATMKLAPVIPVEITPASFTAEKIETRLPSAVADTCVGGGGRYICLLLPTNRQVAVYDVSLGKIVKYFPVQAENARIAAGMNKLLVITPEPATITRYDFTKLEKEVTKLAPYNGTIKAVAMGCASAGPLLVHYSSGTGELGRAPVMLIDPHTLKEVSVGTEQDVGMLTGAFLNRDRMHFRASPDGKTFGAWCTSHTPSGLTAMVVGANSIVHSSLHDAVGHVVPGPDGTLFTSAGLYAVDSRNAVSTLQRDYGRHRLPATSGNQFLELIPNGLKEHGGRNDETGMKATVRLREGGQLQPSLPKFDLPGGEQWLQHDFSIDKRVVFVPGAKAVVVVPSSNDRLISHRFDMKEAMEKAGVVYLFVDSQPPACVPGWPFDYQIMVRSKTGGVKYKLESGPDGLKVSPDGKVTWLPTEDWSAPQSVTISVSDTSRQEIFHTFRLIPSPTTSEIAIPAKSDAKTKTEPRPPIKAEPKPQTKIEVSPAGDEIIQTPSSILPIKPTEIVDNSSVTLPGTADAMCVAGGGRFLVYRIPSARELVLFDVTFGKIVKQIPISDEKALFAGGMTKLFILDPTANIFQQWDLVRMEKAPNTVNPAGGTPRQMVMGHRTDGPVFICGPGVGDSSKNYAFVNTKTWKTANVYASNSPSDVFKVEYGQRELRVRASADGRVYVSSDPHWNYSTSSLVIGPGKAKNYLDFHSHGAVFPGPDGNLFSRTKIFSPELKEIFRSQKFECYPATSGAWYFELRFPDDWGFYRQTNAPSVNAHIVAKLLGDDRLLLTLSDLAGLDSTNRFHLNNSMLEFADRIQLIPEANLLVVLNKEGTKLHLRRLDLKATLAKSDIDYIFVVSRPPETAKRGGKFTYTPEVWSKKGGVKIKVTAGPEGMQESSGIVNWAVPADVKKGTHDIILTVSDASGQENFHSFKLMVKD